MITVNPRPNTLTSKLVEDYRKVAPATLGHILETGMEAAIMAAWRPVKLVGPALTVQAYPQVDAAVAQALKIAQPGDVLVINRGSDLRTANWGEFAAAAAMEAGIVGLVTDGVITDVEALERMGFPVFSRGSTAMTIKRRGIEAGAVNVPVTVGGVVVHPGDLVLGDGDGVIVATPEEARDLVEGCLRKEEWEDWVREQMAKGRTFSELRKERPSS